MNSRPARKPLSADRVVEAALKLVDRHGLDALSMRRLGTALRVEAMSLYKHVPNKGALVDLVVERVLRDVVTPAPGLAWDQRLRHVANELRRIALEHPHVFPLLATRVPSSEHAFAPLEVLLGALEDAGLDDEETLQHFWTFIAYVTGSLLAETAAQSGLGTACIVVPPTLDAATFPHLARLGGAIAACDFATEYARGLDVLIAAASAAGADAVRPIAAKAKTNRGKAGRGR